MDDFSPHFSLRSFLNSAFAAASSTLTWRSSALGEGLRPPPPGHLAGGMSPLQEEEAVVNPLEGPVSS